MDNKFGDHESIMHVIADKLVENFEGVGAVNYIEQIFTDKNDPCKSFVLTMQMVNGLTPCEKLNAANELIAKQAEQIKMLRSTLIDTLTVVQGGLSSTIANGVKALEATKEQA